MQLNRQTDGVEVYQNAANNLTKIWEAKTPDGLERLIQDRALLVMKLRNSAGDEIAADSKIVFGVKEPINDYPSKIDESSYLPFRNKSISEQMDNTKNEHMRLDIDRGGVRLPELNKIIISLESPDVVDWSQSSVELNDVKERSA
jgi:hypothetical protein